MTIKEESLKQALKASRCPELPKMHLSTNERFWIEAIVLVKKCNCSQSYALAKHNCDSSITVTHDFGHMSPIAGIVSIHPYLYLDENFIPKKSKSEIKKALIELYGEGKADKVNNATNEELEMMKIDLGIHRQMTGAINSSIAEDIDKLACALQFGDGEDVREPMAIAKPKIK